MTLFERTKETAKQRGMSLKSLNDQANLGKNAIYSWKTSKPGMSALQAVADVLGVSVDYLLGNTDEMHPSKSENNSTIDLRQVDDSERDELISANGQPISDSDWEIIKAVLAKYERHED
ncbi:helix-turn-helix domain-containing protein [Weissella viridescens]|uniref:helix-turn-helix domain-containing protein n=1 Tax=Weissella viridescens TaxID=1629 RepID=UPI001D0796BA|nr:helix-turn-helix domain-containing protein [Weissella viridescens]MCB6840926.1 helix-turn-helix domain-containing protein [Weissella viridescens]MCB6847686.1 helix-turn-helix domain-containing protein [Weissella viridescens]